MNKGNYVWTFRWRTCGGGEESECDACFFSSWGRQHKLYLSLPSDFLNKLYFLGLKNIFFQARNIFLERKKIDKCEQQTTRKRSIRSLISHVSCFHSDDGVCWIYVPLLVRVCLRERRCSVVEDFYMKMAEMKKWIPRFMRETPSDVCLL